MIATDSYTNIQLDAIKEVANIGAGHAASALSLMLNERVTISITQVNLSDSVLSPLKGSNQETIFFSHPFSGDLAGEIWVATEKDDADMIALKLLDASVYNPVQLLSEISHILAGSYMSAVSDMFRLNLSLLPPQSSDKASEFSLNFQNTLNIDERLTGCSLQFNLSKASLSELLAKCQVA